MRSLSNAVKIGIFILISLFVLLVLVVKVGAYRFAKNGEEFYAYFNSIDGLQKHAPVRLSGFEVGEVRDIKLIYDNNQTQILLTLWLNNDAKPRVDSVARLATLGLMGEKYIEISQGSAGKDFLSPRNFVLSENPIEMYALMKSAQSIAMNFDELLAANKTDLSKAIANLRVTSENMKEFSDDIKCHPWKLIHKTKENK